MYTHFLVSPNSSRYLPSFWENYRIKYIPLKAYQFLILIHDYLGNLENNENIALAAGAACKGVSFEDFTKEAQKLMNRYSYHTLTMAALKTVMEGGL